MSALVYMGGGTIFSKRFMIADVIVFFVRPVAGDDQHRSRHPIGLCRPDRRGDQQTEVGSIKQPQLLRFAVAANDLDRSAYTDHELPAALVSVHPATRAGARANKKQPGDGERKICPFKYKEFAVLARVLGESTATNVCDASVCHSGSAS